MFIDSIGSERRSFSVVVLRCCVVKLDEIQQWNTTQSREATRGNAETNKHQHRAIVIMILRLSRWLQRDPSRFLSFIVLHHDAPPMIDAHSL